uniref:Uncharacterized protein n=1 Tax=Rhizophora mucronata TaxID=61149 RepID=A0A2P2JTN8_RHIMU
MSASQGQRSIQRLDENLNDEDHFYKNTRYNRKILFWLA